MKKPAVTRAVALRSFSRESSPVVTRRAAPWLSRPLPSSISSQYLEKQSTAATFRPSLFLRPTLERLGSAQQTIRGHAQSGFPVPSSSSVPKELAHAARTVVVDSLFHAMREEAPFLLEHPQAIWGAMVLSALGVPKGIIEDAAFRHPAWRRPQELWPVIQSAETQAQVKNALRVVSQLGISAFMAFFDTPTTSQFQAELQQADLMLQSVRYVLGTIEQGLPLAIANGQRTGVEIEFIPLRENSANIPGEFDSIDNVYRTVWDSLRRSDHGWGMSRKSAQDTHLFLSSNPAFFPVLYWMFHHVESDTRVRIMLLRGSGAILVEKVNVTPTGTPFGPQFDMIDLRMEESEALSREKGMSMAADALRVDVGVVRQLIENGSLPETSLHVDVHSVLMLKASNGEMIQIEAQFHPDGVATLSGVNVDFSPVADHISQRSIKVDAKSPEEAYASLVRLAKERAKLFINRNKGAPISFGFLRSDLRIVPEQYGVFEAISPILNPGHYDVVSDVARGIAEEGYLGTSPSAHVGVHVHAEMSHGVLGGGTQGIAELHAALLEYAQYADELQALFAPDLNRLPFIQPLHPDFIQRLPYYRLDSFHDFGVQLAFLTDFVVSHPKKYSGITIDNYISDFIYRFIRHSSGTFPSDILRGVAVGGRTYNFSVNADSTSASYGIAAVVDGKRFQLNRYPPEAAKPTIELRLPNTSMESTSDLPTIDPHTPLFALHFWSAFIAGIRDETSWDAFVSLDRYRPPYRPMR